MFCYLVMIFAYCAAQQEEPLSVPNFAYKSPEAFSFERYGEYNVGEYSGNAQIAIPIYNVEVKDLKLPITLTYQGSGIRVDEEASWVGLGWNLAVGGCVTRVTCGGAERTRSYTWDTIKGVVNRNIDDQTYARFTVCPQYDMYNSNGLYNTECMHDVMLGWGELDYYCANILGNIIYFFINPDTNMPQVIGQDGEKYKIEAYGSHPLVNMWVIADNKGNVYEFSNKEYGWESIAGDLVTAWNMTSIQTPSGAYATLSYSTPEVICYLPKLYECYDKIRYSYNNENDWPRYVTQYRCSYPNSNLEMHKGFLSRIETNNHVITFGLSPREDLRSRPSGSAKKLSSVSVMSKVSGNVVKRVSFTYSYFLSNTIGGDWISKKNYMTGLDSYINKRLKLLSVNDITDDSEPHSHTFEYYEEIGLPAKTSYATDFWGYFNRMHNDLLNDCNVNTRATLIPSSEQACLRNSSTNSNLNINAANRLCSSSAIIQGSLKKITYPTKGYTVFSYEPHEFTGYVPYPDADSEYSIPHSYAIVSTRSTTSDYNSKDIVLPYESRIKLEATFAGSSNYNLDSLKSHNAYVRIQQIGVQSPITHTVSLTTISNTEFDAISNQTNYVMSTEKVLPAGSYKLIVGMQNNASLHNFMGVSGEVTGKRIVSNANEFISIGGGLRIKSIASYDSDGSLATETSYTYSGGKLKSPFDTHEVYSESDNCGEEFNGFPLGTSVSVYRFPSTQCGVSPLTGIHTGGVVVGYSTVTKTTVGRNSGKIVTNYSNNSSPSLFGDQYLYMNGYENGKLTEQMVYDDNDRVLSHVSNQYNSTTTNFRCNVRLKYSGVGSDPFTWNLYVYPYVLVWNRLCQSTETTYVNGSPGPSKTKTYTYSDDGHLLLSVRETTSRANTYTTTYTYPSPESAMVRDWGMTGVVVGEKHSESSGSNEMTLDEKRTEYISEGRGAYMLPYRESYAFTGESLESRIYYTYDREGNVSEVSKDALETVVYLWSYDYSYPVAKIEGATFQQVQSRLGSSVIDSLAIASDSSAIENALSSIRASLTAAGYLITTYTFDPLVGMTSMTDPQGVKTTYLYDNSGRLSEVKDYAGRTLQRYTYNYQ